MRRWIFVLVGAVLFGSAMFFYGLILFQNGLDGLTMQELAIWLAVVGVTSGALLGLLLAWVTAPSVKRWARFLVLGTVGGLLVGLAYGFNVDEACEVGSIDFGACGWPFFGLLLPPWTSFVLWTMTGGIVGGILGGAAGLFTPGRQSSPPARVGST